MTKALKIAVIIILCVFKTYGARSCCDIPNLSYESIVKIDTIKKQIPLNRKGEPEEFYKWKKIVENKSGLPSLEDGVEGLEIRIWYGRSFSNKLQLINIKKHDSILNGELYVLDCVYDKNQDSILSITYTSRKVNPKTGWRNLIFRMNSLKIRDLPNYESIRNYSVCSDGDGVTVEIGTTGKYRIYNYPCYESNSQLWQARNITRMMQLIENEFDFKRLTIKSNPTRL